MAASAPDSGHPRAGPPPVTRWSTHG
ncbi:hypothetical protein DQ392_25130 [Streptomyces reniochalinae]|uniref:Uncharacterized protein n=1 Tax=Streptomyces reniochalinae TaxID=2250578 RepID=A0A367EBS8_9ACTN|nr:hypothetical protein DQ392_25130 [Streptomyces reniochalinae]